MLKTTGPHDPSESTRISCMSDTHGKHRLVKVPKCDVLIHGGDFSKEGETHTVTDLADFFEEIIKEGITKKIICIAGNHDISFHPECHQCHLQEFGEADEEIIKAADAKQYLRARCTYLEDESFIEGENNIHFHGSPWTPTFGFQWAFNQDRDKIHSKWDLIPNETDVLITHGPPHGHGDKVYSGFRAGCVNLLEQVQNRIKPRLHVFGHIHEDPGCTFDGNTLFVNASNCTLYYKPVQPCVVIDLPHNLSEPAMVVIPKCAFTGSEVLDWLKTRGYDSLYPYFEKQNPLLRGQNLVKEDLDLDHLANSLRLQGDKRLNKEARESLRNLKQTLVDAVMQLRIESY